MCLEEKNKILAFGEVLFDVYDGDAVIGGAPLNFASHMKKLGADSLMMTAVGDDELGKKALDFIRNAGVSDRFIAILKDLPTGVCNVTLDAHGKPEYELKTGVAYDEIPFSPELSDEISGGKFDLFYLGTLAMRNEKSRLSAKRAARSGKGRFREVFYDVNIRQNFYSREIVEFGLGACTTLKISRDEAGVFEELGIANTKNDLASLCKTLAEKYSIPRVIMTLDSDGAAVYLSDGDRLIHSEKPHAKVASTVGAGDSFSAAYMHGVLTGKDEEGALHDAITLSSYVVSKIGAIPDYDEDLKKKLGIL